MWESDEEDNDGIDFKPTSEQLTKDNLNNDREKKDIVGKKAREIINGIKQTLKFNKKDEAIDATEKLIGSKKDDQVHTTFPLACFSDGSSLERQEGEVDWLQDYMERGIIEDGDELVFINGDQVHTNSPLVCFSHGSSLERQEGEEDWLQDYLERGIIEDGDELVFINGDQVN